MAECEIMERIVFAMIVSAIAAGGGRVNTRSNPGRPYRNGEDMGQM